MSRNQRTQAEDAKKNPVEPRVQGLIYLVPRPNHTNNPLPGNPELSRYWCLDPQGNEGASTQAQKHAGAQYAGIPSEYKRGIGGDC